MKDTQKTELAIIRENLEETKALQVQPPTMARNLVPLISFSPGRNKEDDILTRNSVFVHQAEQKDAEAKTNRMTSRNIEEKSKIDITTMDFDRMTANITPVKPKQVAEYPATVKVQSSKAESLEERKEPQSESRPAARDLQTIAEKQEDLPQTVTEIHLQNN